MKTKVRVGDTERKLELLNGVTALLPSQRTPSSGCTNVSNRTISADDQQAFRKGGIKFKRFTKKHRKSQEWAGKVFVDRHDAKLCILSQRMTVKLIPTLNKSKVCKALQRYELQVLIPLRFSKHTFDVFIPTGINPIELAQRIQDDPDFVYAEPELIEQCGQRFTPSDPFADRQWQHPTIGAENAWNITRGKNVRIDGRNLVRRPIRIAVLDFGFQLDNPDLEPAIRHVGVFRENGNEPASFFSDPDEMPRDTHGTWCASVALARADNGYPCCGLANEAEFIPVACLTGGIGTQQTLARAIAFAADPTREDSINFRKSDGADVISCSIFPPGFDRLSSVLQDALEYSTTRGRAGKGCPVFYAVANTSQAISKDAMATSEFTLAIGRSNKLDRRKASAHGVGLDFLAPGFDIVISRSKSSTRKIRGTSYATPLAAAVGALVISRNRDIKWSDLRNHLRETCDKVHVNYDNDGFHKKYGFGRINVENALNTLP